MLVYCLLLVANDQDITIQQNFKSYWPPFIGELDETNPTEADTGTANSIY